jgi:hypothetical protein
MPEYFGNTKGIIDWDSIVDICKKCNNPEINTPQGMINRNEFNTEGNLLNSYHEVLGTWINAGYNLNEIVWSNYYPGHHFAIEIQNTFADFVNADPLRVFVSKVMPGRNVPYYRDVEYNEQEWLKEGSIERWVCFIDQPCWGSIFILENQAFHNTEQHSVYKWDSYRSWHARTNCGIYPQYLFHFIGRSRCQ